MTEIAEKSRDENTATMATNMAKLRRPWRLPGAKDTSENGSAWEIEGRGRRSSEGDKSEGDNSESLKASLVVRMSGVARPARNIPNSLRISGSGYHILRAALGCPGV